MERAPVHNVLILHKSVSLEVCIVEHILCARDQMDLPSLGNFVATRKVVSIQRKCLDVSVLLPVFDQFPVDSFFVLPVHNHEHLHIGLFERDILSIVHQSDH